MRNRVAAAVPTAISYVAIGTIAVTLKQIGCALRLHPGFDRQTQDRSAIGPFLYIFLDPKLTDYSL